MSKSSIVIDTNDEDATEQTDDGAVIKLPDGNVVIDLSSRRKDEGAEGFDKNLALKMDAGSLAVIAEQLLQGIEADITSRREREQTRSRGIELLGLKLEEPKSDVGTSASGVEGMSTVRDPLLLEAILRFQANAIGELLPAEGPVKIKNIGTETIADDGLAEELEKDFNHYLTDTSTEYYPDTKRMLFWTGFGGSGWKKVYSCPIRRRPVAESIDEDDLIISNGATDLWNAGRVTHRITMRPSIMKRMQYLGVYRDVNLGQPSPQPTQVDQKKESVEGVRPNQDRPEDQPYTLYECYCEIDLDDYAPKDFKGEGIPLPFRVTIDKDSREILELHRNWKEEDKAALPRKYFVKYPYIEGMGIYGIGLLHILGNLTTALTAAVREMLDAGMFANFPGFVVAKSATKQLTNEFRIPPGGGVAWQADSGNIRDAVMALPYKDITPGLLGLVDKLREVAQRLGGTADMPVGEGKQDAPVGTTIALIEQATKVESAVHKGLHHAQAEEFQLLKERFKEDPEAFWRHNPNCATQWTKEKFLAALENCDLVPVADPNTPSHMHRLAKGVALKTMATTAPPGLYDMRKVDTYVGQNILKIPDFDQFFAPPPPPNAAPDPNLITAQAKLITAQSTAQKVQAGVVSEQSKLQDAQEQRQSDQDIATMNLAKELVIHSSDQQQQQHTNALEVAKSQAAHGLEQQQQGVDTHQAVAQHLLAAQGQAHDQMHADRTHGLDLSKHALDATQAAHDATIDVHNALNPPQPKTPAKKAKT